MLSFIVTDDDLVVAVTAADPVFLIVNSTATTLHPLSAGTHTAYASVGYLSPIETALYLTSTPLKPSACERLDAVVFTSAAAVVAVTVPSLVAVSYQQP